jgi:hypothetical protein
MANAGAPLPAPNPEGRGSNAGTLSDLINGLLRILGRLPVLAQVMFFLMLVAAAGVLVYLKYIRPPNQPPVAQGMANQPPIAQGMANQPYIGGTFDPNHPNNDNKNPQNQEAQDKSAEDQAANNWHMENRAQDDPPEMPIADLDSQNYVHYRFFAKTDKCVYVIRSEAGKIYHQWIRDPQYHFHDIHTSTGENRLPFDSPVHASLASVGFGALSALDGAKVTPVQAQFCVNPHPGNFTFWWGPPVDACSSPMYRQFGDGCVHYQLYNRCANVWDPRIFWTLCHPPPHY